MKLVVQVKLLPAPEQAPALAATLPACNTAANVVSAVAFEQRVFSRHKLQKLVYEQVKAAGLSAQPALHVIRKVADAYTTLHAQIEAGLLGPEGSRRRRKAESKPVSFRDGARSRSTTGACRGRWTPAPCRSGRQLAGCRASGSRGSRPS